MIISILSVILATLLSYLLWVFLWENWIVPAVVAIGLLSLPYARISGWDWLLVLLFSFGLYHEFVLAHPSAMVSVFSVMVIQSASLFLVRAILERTWKQKTKE
jgi:hypothetical protein